MEIKIDIDLKHEKIKNFLDFNGLEGLIFASQTNFLWLTGGRLNNVIRNDDISLVYLFLTKEKRYLIATESDAARVIEEELAGLDFELIKYNWFDQSFVNGIKKTGITGKIGADFSFGDYRNIENEIINIRRNLNTFELKKYLNFCKDYSEIITDYCFKLKKNLTETEVAAGLNDKCFRSGIKLPILMVGSDERVFKFRHPCFTNKEIDKYILIATCAEREGIYANVSRSIHFGKTPSELLSKQKAVNFIISSFFAESVCGKNLVDLFEKGKTFYKEAGYPNEWRNHLQGGISGYKPLEYVINATNKIAINENNIMGFNPTIAGVKAEDPILIEKNKSQITVFNEKWPYEEFKIKDRIFKRPVILEL